MTEAPARAGRPTQDQLLEWMQTLSNWGRWGDDDQLGTLNLLSPEKTRRALSLVKEGATVSCARRISYQAGPDSQRPPQHFMVAAGDAYRPGEGPDRQVAMDYFGLVFHGHKGTSNHFGGQSHYPSASAGRRRRSAPLARDAPAIAAGASRSSRYGSGQVAQNAT